MGRALVVSEPPVILAGFSQGAAAALWLASEGALPAAAALVVGSTARYLEAIGGGGPSPGLAIHFVLGADERHVGAAREAARELEARGAAVTVDVRPGLGHAFPAGWDAELPGLLARLRRPPPPR